MAAGTPQAEDDEVTTEIPFRLSRRPRDARGLVIPYAQYIKPDGTPDYRVMDDALVGKAVRRRLCGLCGDKMRGDVWFIGGPKCVTNGYFHDPAMHRECALHALQACPHLARAKGKYAPLPDHVPGAMTVMVGAMDTDQKAEWFGLMRSTDFTSFRDEHSRMIIIKAKLPWVSVQRWKDGAPMDSEDAASKPLVISNYDPDQDESIFQNDFGQWNVSRALRDCRAGMHKLYLLDVEEAYKANEGVEVDPAKVAELMKVTGEFEPSIGVMENGAVWYIDGHHRLRVYHNRGQKDFKAYIIEEEDSKPYRVLYNGERKPPFNILGKT